MADDRYETLVGVVRNVNGTYNFTELDSVKGHRGYFNISSDVDPDTLGPTIDMGDQHLGVGN